MWGISPSSRDIPFERVPELGKSPVEAWHLKDEVPGNRSYTVQHAGNPIMEIRLSDGFVLLAR